MNYKDLPDDTRVWIYQSNRKFSDDEVASIRKEGEDFTEIWTSHGTLLKAALEVFHNQFVVFFADEKTAEAGGCSIDKSVYFIKHLEQKHTVSLLDRTMVAYKDGDVIATLPQEEFFEKVGQGTLSEDTIVFNNLVNTKHDLDNKWQVPLKDSWHRELTGD
jgi:hypothetical protein